MTATHKSIGWLTGMALLIGLMATVSLWSFRQIEHTAEARQQHNASLRDASDLMASLISAETNQRGYLLTGDESFLPPYLKMREHVQTELARLRLGKGPAQSHLDTAAPLIEARLHGLEVNLELRRSNDLPAALENVRSGATKPLMDSIQKEVSEYTQLVERERDAHEVSFQSSLTRLYVILVLTSLLTLLIAVSFAWLIHRQTAQRLQREVHQMTRRSLETVQASEDKLAVTLQSIGDAVIATDDQARVTLMNPQAEKLTGWTRTEAKGRPIDQIFHIIREDTRLPSPIPVLATLAHGTTQGLVNHTLLIGRAGTECAIADSCAPIREHTGKVVGAVLVFRDVSTERTTQHALRDLQFYTRSLIDSNLDALVMTDPHGVITDVNQPMEALTGRTRDELIGSAFEGCFIDAARAAAGIALVLRQRKVSDYELTADARGGRQTVVSCNATTFFDREGKLQGVFAAARDVTERKRLDLALLGKNEELEKANLAKSEFLSSMSHELRSPLNAILGFAQLMESEASPPPTASQTMGIAQILKAGWHLLTLINEILDLAKVESGQVPLSQEPVSLAEVLLDCRDMIGPQAQHRGIQLDFPRFAQPCFVLADRTRLKQVVLNLLSNAIKYNTPGGNVGVSWTEPSAGLIRVSVRDTGAGLTPTQLGHLFQAFNRLGQEGRGEEGTGIGLVVSKRLIELMGGSIGVESTPGTGSVFWIELAAVEGPAEFPEVEFAPAEGTLAPAMVPGRTVLYVEDNPANLLLVKQIIARLPGIELLTATDGYSGIELARASRPDVVLMDINLPGINGLAAMQILRADPATARIPVVALSANALPHDVERGLAAGFFRYITKPLKVSEFIHSLQLALDVAGGAPRASPQVRRPARAG